MKVQPHWIFSQLKKCHYLIHSILIADVIGDQLHDLEISAGARNKWL